jgi:ferredoxin/quinol-cytochrome oxidoreductase complex cytochrome b subunit/coenzyme F420-reducing hydrogenase delta subunit
MSVRKVIQRGFDRFERLFDKVFGPNWNPFSHLGPLGWLMFWIVAVTGLYLFIFFDTGVHAAFDSVEWITNEQWIHAGLARSLHRYASDMMVLVMLIHLVREWANDRFRGRRWFSWLTGVPLIWFVYISGITGYWLVWDKLAQYVAVTSTELLDALPIFAEPIARNFLSPESLSDRFFTLMVFLHIAIPLVLLLTMWIHIQRITTARTSPPRELTIITLIGLVVASYAIPATSQGPADLAVIPQVIGIDWLILSLYPVIESVPPGVIWTGSLLLTVLLAGLPWLPPRREGAAAVVTLDHCNGCARCVSDCPYAAIKLVPRSDGAAFTHEVEVNADRCVACGICMGACPSSTPFRRSEDLLTGIDLPDRPLSALREEVIAAAGSLKGPGRVLTLSCSHGAAADAAPGRVVLPCVAMVPPSLIDYIISRDLADGVAIAGCAERECFNRYGREWTEQRFARERDPYLRERVPRERLTTIWRGTSEAGAATRDIAEFGQKLAAMPAYEKARPIGAGSRPAAAPDPKSPAEETS